MLCFTKHLHIASITILVMTSAAYAQQPPQSDMSRMPGMSGGQMPGMGGTQGRDMGGMSMQAMMKHCARSHRNMSQGKPMSPRMQKMMAQCDQMDHGMRMDAPAPDATRSR